MLHPSADGFPPAPAATWPRASDKLYSTTSVSEQMSSITGLYPIVFAIYFLYNIIVAQLHPGVWREEQQEGKELSEL